MSASFYKLEGAHVTICESNKLQSPQYKWIIIKCFKVVKKKNANEHIMHIDGKDLPMTMGVMEEFTITKSMVDKGKI